MAYVDGYYKFSTIFTMGPATLNIDVNASAAKAGIDWIGVIDSKFTEIEHAAKAFVKIARINVNVSWAFRSCWYGAADLQESTDLVKMCGVAQTAVPINVPFWQFDLYDEEGLDWCLMGDCEAIGWSALYA